MRKFRIGFMTVILIATTVISFAACGQKSLYPKWEKERVANADLYNTKGYRDYAKEAVIDVNLHPELAKSGLFWCKWDSTTKQVIDVKADTAEGAALVDPSKPTIIMVHGIMLNEGYKTEEKFIAFKGIATPSDFGLESDSVVFPELWIKAGYNVAKFNYNRWADEGVEITAGPKYVESKIWGTDGNQGMRYRNADGTFSEKDVVDFSISEYFAGEYMRAMRLLSEDMGKQSIRIAAHSMGAELCVAATFLLSELAADGQLPAEQVPDRLALLDGYLSYNIEPLYEHMGARDLTISWSGKNIINRSLGETMIECFKEFAANGIAVEFYMMTNSNVTQLPSSVILPDVKKYCVFTTVDVAYSGGGYSVLTNGHNALRDWYFGSINSDVPKDVTIPEVDAYAVSAKSTTQNILDRRGISYVGVGGQNTLWSSDDTYRIEAKLN